MTDTTIPTTPVPEPASRISLQARVFLAMSLLLLATLCGTSWVETERARESYERDIRSHVNGIWKSLDELVRPLLIERNVPLLTTIALKLTDRETADNPLQGMAFLSRDMITLAHSHPASAPVDLESRRASDIIQFLRPIRPPERTEPLGYLRLEYSTMPLGQKQDEILRAHLWLFVFLLFFAWMLAGVVARALKAPLRSLEETANQLSSGRLDARVPGQPQEDLGSLVDSFNRMADSIGAHLKDLDQKNVSLERRVFELSTLQQAGRIINSVLNLDRLYEVIVDTTIQVLGGVKRCSLMLADRPSNEFVIKIAKGLDVGNLPDNRRVPITDGVAGKVFQTGEPILINDLAEGEKTLMLDPARISRSSICVPIKVNDDVIGIISAGNKMTGEPFTANDLALLETLATQAGIAMKNAKLYFDLDRKIIELGTLHEVGKSLSMVLEIEVLLEMILEMTGRVLGGVRSSSLILFDEETGRLQVKVHKGVQRNLVNKTIKIGEGIAGKVFERGQPLLITTPKSDDEMTDQVTNTSIKSSICVPLRAKENSIGVLAVSDKLSGAAFDENDLEMLSTLGAQIAIAIHNAKLYEDLEASYLAAVRALANSLDAKDTYTRGHSERVALYSVAIGRRMNLNAEDIRTLQIGSLLHDIGKIGISEAIIRKPTRLSDDEYELIKTHPVQGASIIEPAKFLRTKIPLVKYHHERYDGKGYPEGLVGEGIPLLARIVCVADSYDAMTSKRAYRDNIGTDHAVQELLKHSGTQFDPKVVGVFLELLKDPHFLEEVAKTTVQ